MADTAHATRHDDAESVDKLREMITDIRIAMVTTEGRDGAMHSRPMHLQEAESGGDLWFATSMSSALVQELREDARMLVTFAEPGSNRYAVVRGEGRVERDMEKIQELWNPSLQTWFPNGPTDPDLTLIHVKAKEGDYWDAPSGPARLVKFVAGFLGGSRPDGGERVKVDLGAHTQRS
ncbi:MAG TPA: pyridoxamine 5'-phosphate oxidase family protein [Gemmatimonas sp.]|nr:pyridoxamine 5'-phosphate oxidase family protein [Gemmatimonas sp.]